VRARPRERAGFVSKGGAGNYGVARNGRGAQGSPAGGTTGGPGGSTGECGCEWERIPKRLRAWGANDGFGLGHTTVR
jgi:hypothetical protein